MIKFGKILVITISLLAASCVKETFPQDNQPSHDQVVAAPNVFEGFVNGMTTALSGEFVLSGENTTPYDFGYSAFFLQRDVMGQDIMIEANDWLTHFGYVSVGLGPGYLVCQYPWRYYYRWINNCNNVIRLAGEEPDEDHKDGAGIAYAMRAMFYMDLARMYQLTYVGHEDAPTVPIRTESTTMEEVVSSPNATNEEIWAFILSDLDKAEELIANYDRNSVYTPDLSVVYGFKARAYLTMENWEQAEKYAKLAQSGYSVLNEAEYTDRMTAFNTPNHAWMFGLVFNATSPNILENDSDSNWGSQMFLEVKGGLYASAYGQPKRIDAHLYETIPATDFRKKCFIDPALDKMSADDRTATLIADYSNYPQYIDQCASATASKTYGHLPLKFRAAGGTAGRENPYAATVASVPIMRVEEMMLIEAEAAGMQSEERGKALLQAFATTRDAAYRYDNNASFQDNVWWQRRVELWGEGFATFDIKRLSKGIIRSYAGTNHIARYRWNTDGVPDWMNLCIVQTETNYNPNIVSFPAPVAPIVDSPEHVW